MPDRIQREVEELLTQLDRFPPKKPLSRKVRDAVSAPYRVLSSWRRDVNLPSITAGHILLAGIVMIVVGWVALSGSVGTAVLGVGILLFIGAFALSLRRQSKPPEKYWRDRPIDDRRRRR